METNEVKVEKEDGKVKKLEKQVNGLCAVLRKLKSECEKHWGIDIDGDGKIGSIRMNALLLLLCVGVVAAVMAGDLVNYPTPSGGVGFSVDDSGNATVGGTLTVSGATSISTISATTVAATAAITLTDSDSNAVVTVTGFELSDASLILDADQGDDNADTWTLKSAASDNDLDIINHTTTSASLTAAGVLSVLGGIDGIGLVDLDIGSADVTDVTVVTDGGTVVIDGEVTIDGKWATVGGDATTALMIQKAACTAPAAAVQTNTFAVVFGAAPIVTCTYTEDPGDVRPIFVTSVTTSNFVANITADKNYGYIAVGTRP
jgi:hypothetical protein